MPAFEIGFLAFPRITQLDLTGPLEVLSRLPGARLHVLAKTRGPIATEGGLTLLPTESLLEAPALDVVCVPGGIGVNDLLLDDPVLDWLARAGEKARLVTSVCTGALLLGASGLLRGYLATTHWLAIDLLPLFGATPISERVVVDRNRVTGAGVTAGIDLGLRLASLLQGEEVARRIALGIEYAPADAFPGSPRSAAPALVSAVLEGARTGREERRRLCQATAARRASKEAGPL